jgi:NAD(P)-dependent dehydrogenase (short-subunit alcohol dehydrogenase family)
MRLEHETIGEGAGWAHKIGREACPRLAAAGWSVAALELEGDAARETAEPPACVNGAHAAAWPAK